MRRRPSAEDEDAARTSTSVSATAAAATTQSASTRVEKSRDARAGQERKHSRDRNPPSHPEGLAKTDSNAAWSNRAATPDWTAAPTEEARPSNGKKAAATAEVPSKSPRHAAIRSPWACSALTLITTACSILLLITIFRSFLTLQLDPKGCAMSYMRPSFVHFSDFDTEHTRFASKYSLYFYREGGVDEDTRVKGIPVLFIPGNAGSYKQVRPIAAEAAHFFHDSLRRDADAMSEGKRPLDVFTVDFNEELTAFHGQTLLDQAEYLNEAVAYILALYHNPQRSLREPGLPDPKSVIIIGHSMGGMVARTMLHMPNYQESSINTIFTLSTPHARAPVSFDAAMVATYENINAFWRRSFSLHHAAKNPLADVTLISVAGGGLDTMIPSEFSSLTSLVPDTHGFTVFTSAIPQVWTGMDHLAIMWCDQFRKALVRAIFDVVDVRRSSQTLVQPARIKALRKRLLTGMESVVEKGALDHIPATYLTLDQSSTTILSHGERLELDGLGQLDQIKARVLPVPSDSALERTRFTLLTDQHVDSHGENGTLGVFLCTVYPPVATRQEKPLAVIGVDRGSPSTHLACKSAASDVSLLPRSTRSSQHAFDNTPPISYLQYNLADLADYQFVAVVDKSPHPSKGWVLAEFAAASQSTITVSRGHHQLLLGGMSLRLSQSRPTVFELKIPEVHSTLFAYRLVIDRRQHDQCEEKFTPLLRQSIQEPYESKYFVNTAGGNINVHGISPYMPPPLRGGGASEGLSLQLWTDTSCKSTVNINLTVDILGSAGKLVMRYRTAFAAFPILVVAIVLRKQFKVYDMTGVFISFSQSMDQCIRTSLPVIFAALTFLTVALSKASQVPWSPPQRSSSEMSEYPVDFTMNDLMLGTSDPFFWFLVPLFGTISVGVCIATNYLVLTVTHVSAFIYARVQALTQTTEESRSQSSPAFTAASINRRVVLTAILVLLVVTVIPYHFAYVVLCIMQLVTSIRALRVAQEPTGPLAYNLYNYAHSLLVLMLGILPINMPVLVVWIHNLAVHWLTPFSTHHNLFSVMPYILLVEIVSTGSMIPRASPRLRFVTNVSLFGFALYAAVYGVTYAYRLHYMVNGLCAWLFFLHFTNGSLSPAKWVSPAVNAGGTVKKRP